MPKRKKKHTSVLFYFNGRESWVRHNGTLKETLDKAIRLHIPKSCEVKSFTKVRRLPAGNIAGGEISIHCAGDRSTYRQALYAALRTNPKRYKPYKKR